ncbi:GNAT family N-acetyltransferase [Pseudoblastomonas halimionae]|uniref:GNAT family N-acetyltransferase n=1 Tax=Alteriqipengyuania halimionae TaxID=1926630 RepID=A0A6I4TZT6_9SPHN|nr:N-acetyltransferase [Alteriqipengyuania halimionae]MXP09016.1 GNAT family N-acetyltransferase [Alteriqipengyuania halimionae]
MPAIIPLDSVDPVMVEQLLDRVFGPERAARTAYRIREGLEPLAGLSFAALDDEDMLAATIQCWPIALTDPRGKTCPLIMVGPVAVVPEVQGQGYGRALFAALADALGEGAPPQVLIGDPEYYGRFGYSDRGTMNWDTPGPVERHRLLVRGADPAVLPSHAMLGPWRADLL